MYGDQPLIFSAANVRMRRFAYSIVGNGPRETSSETMRNGNAGTSTTRTHGSTHQPPVCCGSCASVINASNSLSRFDTRVGAP
jgi:hypothetical protein